VLGDIVSERRAQGVFPPGPNNFSIARTQQVAHDPLSVLLPLYEEHGPIFSLRILHGRVVFMLGPEANHYVTVSHANTFSWREGSFGDLIPLLGDGLLTIDGDHQKRARRIMLPAFHSRQVAGSIDVMLEEAGAALDSWAPGQVVDAYGWMRELAMRIAMRALLGLDPDDGGHGREAALAFEEALSFYGTDFPKRLIRGPGSPWRRMTRARAEIDRIVYAEVEARRANPDSQATDIMSMLIQATDEDGTGLSDKEIRDQVVTLMFAGHDTSTSTLSFLLYELSKNPHVLEGLWEEQDRVLGQAPPTAENLVRDLPRLDMALDETLRLYPPAWIGPRRAVEDFEFGGHRVRAGTYVNYCSWASHRIPEVFPEPEAFIPERFTPEAKAALPKGAYIPFGGGSRTCIGMRFGQLEIKAVATLLLQRHRLELMPGRTMTIRQMPTLSPTGGLPMRVRERAAA
jgi:cytochrome P450